MIRVALLDSHPIFRRGLRIALETRGDIVVAAEASRIEDLLQQIAGNPCDILITEISLGERNGLEVLPQIQASSPETQVIVLTVYPASQFAAAAFRAGASSYLTKSCTPAELLQAVRVVAKGRKHVTTPVAEVLAAALHTGQPSVFELLSAREVQVLRLYCTGKTITEISDETGLNVRTVSTYKTRIREKLGLATNADLVAYAVTHDVIQVAVSYTQGDVCASCAISPFRSKKQRESDPALR